MAAKFRSKNRVFFKDPGDHDVAICDHRLHGELIHKKVARATEGKEQVEVRQGIDPTRGLIVPNRNPLEIPGIFRKSEFDRLTKQSKVVTPAERQAMIDEAEHKIFVAQMESEERKTALRNAQLWQRPQPGSTLGEIESEAEKKNQYVLQRAYEMRQENEEEVRGVNGVILATKCKAIREAQIQEKELIRRELEEEDRRLDMMMEQTRQLGLREEAKKREMAAERSNVFITQIKQQMKETELELLMAAEHKEEEAKMINRALIALQHEEAEKDKQKSERRAKIQAELRQANEDMEKYKALQKEEARLCDMRLNEFMRKKEEREIALEKEKADLNAAKEREIARLRAQQEKVSDLQALKDEQSAQRIQEEKDREYRRREKEAALKKKILNEQLRMDREKQIQDIRKAQAIQLARDEEEFHKVAKTQHGLFAKDQEKLALKKEVAAQNRKFLLKQVEEKERQRIEERKKKIEDGNALRIEVELRDIRIEETLKKKVDGLKECNVPEHCINDIQRQVNLKLEKIRNRI